MIRTLGLLSVLLITGLTLFMGVDLLVRGAGGFSVSYLFAPTQDLGRAGGIGPVLLSTMMIVGAATLLATLFSLPTAVAYTEMVGPSWFRRFVHALLDTGVGVPRIVWGLFGGVFFGGVLGFGFSALTGVITLACLLAPILATGFIEGLEAVDPELREQCRALGVSPWKTLWLQIFPAARPSLVASMALAVGRGFGDAAALLFTAGLVTRFPDSMFDSAATLAVFIFNLLTSVPGGQKAAYTAAAVLYLITLALQIGIAAHQTTGKNAT